MVVITDFNKKHTLTKGEAQTLHLVKTGKTVPYFNWTKLEVLVEFGILVDFSVEDPVKTLQAIKSAREGQAQGQAKTNAPKSKPTEVGGSVVGGSENTMANLYGQLETMVICLQAALAGQREARDYQRGPTMPTPGGSDPAKLKPSLMEQYIEDYYMMLFPKYHPSRVLTLVCQPFAFGAIAILAYYEAKLNTRKRNLFGYTLFFISSLMLDLATSGKGGTGHYIGLCIISGCFGVADALAQGGVVRDLSFMSPDMIQSFLAGLAASGTLTSALRLITKAAFSSSRDGLRKGALLFFGVTSFMELLCVLLYAFTFPKLPIVKYYRSKTALEGAKTVLADLAAGGDIQTQPSQDEEDPKLQKRLTNKELIFQNKDYAFDLFLIYVLTFSIILGFLSEDTGSHSLGSWCQVILFAMYNVLALIGRYVPLIKGLMMKSRMDLLIAILSRFLFVQAFYFTAKYGDQGWVLMLTSLLGLTNGTSLYGPEQNALGNLLIFFLFGSVIVGVTLDWLWFIGKGW
ncbi:hypothetical protein NE237_001255 [Protea cynaroides]|uniref:Uncharacterized protein n=1 Tax=Protea cynaroides TaxID=273540 RepID=A0A9Q0KTS9_9MAGN|nr:hypothetical protein NE237_001255 [Protea cynaroides]